MSPTDTWPHTTVLPPPASPDAPTGPADGGDALPIGTLLDDFEIVRVLGSGGFGIVYLALDRVLLREVAIKEYMPISLAGRSHGATVSVRSAELAQTFDKGLESFFNEARLLASFDHPSLVKVHRCWKANGTAYMAMQYLNGRTLKQARREILGTPDEARLHALVEPLLGALEVLHAADVCHRDISPDNIILSPDGHPVLLDFGSARRIVGNATQDLTAILKPHFAPIEQYGDQPGMKQGPWTDLYALGASLHFLLCGQPPAPAVMRAVRDMRAPLSAGSAEHFPAVSQAFLSVVDWMLAVAPENRPQSVAALRQALRRGAPAAELQLLRPADAATPVDAAGRDAAGKQLRTRLDSGGRALASADERQTTAPSATGKRRLSRATVTASLVFAALGGGALAGIVGRVERPAQPAAATPIGDFAERPSSSAVAAAPAALPSASSSAVPARKPTSRAQVPAALSVAEGLSASPSTLCGPLRFPSRTLCTMRQCQEPRWAADPLCRELRDQDERRRLRMEP